MFLDNPEHFEFLMEEGFDDVGRSLASGISEWLDTM
jgi:hypothetical protein